MIVASGLGQSTNASSCPIISVAGPAGIPKSGEPVTFTASIENPVGGSNPNYKWTARNGEIIDGQGTPQVKVSWPDWCDNLELAVEVQGLPNGCPTKAREIAGISHCKPFGPSKIAEVLEKTMESSDTRLSQVKQALRENPHAQVYAIVRHFNDLSRKVNEKRQKQIIRLLNLPIAERSRFAFIHIRGAIDLTEFWLVPPVRNFAAYSVVSPKRRGPRTSAGMGGVTIKTRR